MQSFSLDVLKNKKKTVMHSELFLSVYACVHTVCGNMYMVYACKHVGVWKMKEDVSLSITLGHIYLRLCSLLY